MIILKDYKWTYQILPKKLNRLIYCQINMMTHNPNIIKLPNSIKLQYKLPLNMLKPAVKKQTEKNRLQNRLIL